MAANVQRPFFSKDLDFPKIVLTFAVQYRGVEQSVARRAHNPEVAGSSPAPATKQTKNNPETQYKRFQGVFFIAVFAFFVTESVTDPKNKKTSHKNSVTT